MLMRYMCNTSRRDIVFNVHYYTKFLQEQTRTACAFDTTVSHALHILQFLAVLI